MHKKPVCNKIQWHWIPASWSTSVTLDSSMLVYFGDIMFQHAGLLQSHYVPACCSTSVTLDSSMLVYFSHNVFQHAGPWKTTNGFDVVADSHPISLTENNLENERIMQSISSHSQRMRQNAGERVVLVPFRPRVMRHGLARASTREMRVPFLDEGLRGRANESEEDRGYE